MSDEAAELEIHEPVDEVPGVPTTRRTSKWDPVVEQAKATGKWVPVTKPHSFTSTTVRWLRERTDGLIVEVRADKVYLKWDPETAAKVAKTEPAAEPEVAEE